MLVAPWVLVVAASEAFGPSSGIAPEQALTPTEVAGIGTSLVPLALELMEAPSTASVEAFDEPARPGPVVVEPIPDPTPLASAPVEAAPPEIITPPVVVTTPRAPAPTPTRVAARGNSMVLAPAEIYALTLEVSGDPSWATWATRVIACESGGRVNAISPGGHYGLGQVASGHPYDFTRMISEPRYAVEAMLAIYRASGPAAWSCK